MEPHYSMFLEEIAQIIVFSPVTRVRAKLLDDEAREVRSNSFVVLKIYTRISYMRVSHRDYLPSIGRIREYLLIPGDRRIEDDLADLFTRSTDRRSSEDCAVGQYQRCFHRFSFENASSRSIASSMRSSGEVMESLKKFSPLGP